MDISRGILLIFFFFCYVEAQIADSTYYINATQAILSIGNLPFHETSHLLDDTVIVDEERKWLSFFDGSACLITRCSTSTDTCFALTQSSEISSDMLMPITNPSQRYLQEVNTTALSSNYLLLADICEPNQNCIINKNYNGICINQSNYIEPEPLMAGEECSFSNYRQTCGYGLRQCQNGICAGIDNTMRCQTSWDCWPNTYCNLYGNCVTPKNPGDSCTNDEECGRTAGCYFSDLRINTGICVQYFSRMNGESVATYTGHDNLFTNMSNQSKITF